MSASVQKSIQKELVQHERNILLTVQDALEFKDNKSGLTEDEYDNDGQALSAQHKEKEGWIHEMITMMLVAHYPIV